MRLAGADADNLVFNEDISSGTTQELLIMAISTNLPLDQTDAATYSYELSGPWPVVSQDETLVAREIVTLPNTQPALLLDTSQGENRLRRYFLVHERPSTGDINQADSLLYVFRAEAPASLFESDDYRQVLEIVATMASSLQVVQ